MFSSPDYKEENSLAELLGNIEKPTLSWNRQEILKSKLRAEIRRHEREVSIEQEAWFVVLRQKLSEIAREVTLPFSKVFFLREKILAMLPSLSQRKNWFRFPSIFTPARAFAGATLALFLVFLLSTVFFAPSVTRASPISIISDLEGQVEIVRNGKVIPASKNLRLKPKDIVKTYEGSKATIHYMDDSLTRLSENTELRIRKLFVNPVDYTRTIVDLELINGGLWARVLSLIDEFSKFQVRAENTILTAKKRATFHVAVAAKGKAKVVAVQNAVDVSVASPKKKVVETTLLNGYQLDVQNGKTTVTPTKDTKEASETIAQNLEEDKVFIEEIISRDKEERLQKIEPPVFPKVLVLDELKAAEAKLVQAELLLDTTIPENAGKLLEEFDEIIAGVSQKIDELQKTDPVKANQLSEEFDRKLRNYKKQFVLFLPDDSLYPLKEAVADAELTLSATPVEVAEKKLEQASEKLLEAQALAESGKTELATDQLQIFNETVTEVVSETASLEASEQEEVVSATLEQKVDHLKLLEALSAEVRLELPPAVNAKEKRGVTLREMISKAKKDSLADVGEALAAVSASETPSVETLKKVEEIENLDVNLTPVVTDATLLQSTSTDAVTTNNTGGPIGVGAIREIKSDPFSGVTVITIEAKPSTVPLPSSVKPLP